MTSVHNFRSKPLKIISWITLAVISLLFVLLLIFNFNVIALLLFILILSILTYVIFILNRRKIIINNDSLTIVEFLTESINAQEIETIELTPIYSITIKTTYGVIRSSGYLFLRGCDSSKNEKLVEELNNWLKNIKISKEHL